MAETTEKQEESSSASATSSSHEEAKDTPSAAPSPVTPSPSSENQQVVASSALVDNAADAAGSSSSSSSVPSASSSSTTTSTTTTTTTTVPSSPTTFESEWTIWYDKKPTKQQQHQQHQQNTKEQSGDKDNNKGEKKEKAADNNNNDDEQKINYQENLKRLGKFSNIEEFWSLYSHLAAASDLSKNSNYHIFRGDVLPMWESFPQGGCWNVRVPKSLRAARTLTRLWDSLVLAVVGETFEEPDIVGINVCIRGKDDLISVWTRDSKARSRFRIGEKLKKELIELKVPAGIEYKHHVTSMKDRSTFRNAQPWSPRTGQSATNSRHKKEKK